LENTLFIFKINRKEEVLICNKNDLIVEIDYLDVKNNIEKILIPLNSKKEISNNKLFYK